MRKNFLVVFKIGILIILVGFFCPVSCNMNGWQIIRYSFRTQAIIRLGVPFVAILLFSILALFFTENDDSDNQHFWLLFLPNFLAEFFLIMYYREGIVEKTVVLNFGFYVMVFGYILSFIFLICASCCKNEDDGTDG